MDAVGKPLPGNQPVLDWTSVMATWPDDAVPDDTLCKINGISTGQGRPPTVYFLWRHRFDVYGGFGVGPSERPEVETTKAETMLGVVHPPTNPVTFGTPWDEPMATVEESQSIESEPTEETTLRYATMEEWYARWNPLFDILAAHDDKPSEGEKEEMLATLPEDTGGEPANTILARSFYEAKVRSRS